MDENQQLRCPHCGRVQMFDDKVCPYCGQPLNGRKKYVTVKQKAREQRAIQHQGHRREDRKTTYVPQDSDGVWSGPEKKRDPDPKKAKTRKLLIAVAVAVAFTQLMPLVFEVLDQIRERVEESFERNQEPDMPDIYLPNMELIGDLNELEDWDLEDWDLEDWDLEDWDLEDWDLEEMTLSTTEPEYYTISEDEEIAMIEDALWYHQELWQERIPKLQEEDIGFLQTVAGYVEDENGRERILKKLEEDDQDMEKAQWALDVLEVDWDTQALRCMLGYLHYSSFTPSDMEGQLEYEGFTPEQIQYAMDNCQVDWYHQLEMEANERFRYFPYAETEFAETLAEWGFRQEDIERYMETLTVDWKEQAVNRVQVRLEHYGYNRDEMTDYLREAGFREEEIQYAIQNTYD